MSAYVIALFVALVPGTLLRIPAGGSKLTVAVVHGVLFAAILHYTYSYFLDKVQVMVVSEGFAATKANGAVCNNNNQCVSQRCKKAKATATNKTCTAT